MLKFIAISVTVIVLLGLVGVPWPLYVIIAFGVAALMSDATPQQSTHIAR
ncbi:Uncharacterised protein [Mycobacteroides abscessus subsp. abscessus]|nr:Uncharacterised protein [Mycobacteroides abscessus subsp. abscessus]